MTKFPSPEPNRTDRRRAFSSLVREAKLQWKGAREREAEERRSLGREGRRIRFLSSKLLRTKASGINPDLIPNCLPPPTRDRRTKISQNYSWIHSISGRTRVPGLPCRIFLRMYSFIHAGRRKTKTRIPNDPISASNFVGENGSFGHSTK